ncbi:MAG TPA: phage baseplate assembly protein V [Solirubrobacteraceae bacterium]|nr:phage baseplate assembly protein V [Solirubrobacteraceae bacterium]
MSTVAAAADLAAGCTVLLGGSAIDPSLASSIMEVRVETTVGLPDVCTLRLAESDPSDSGALKVIDNAAFSLGTAVVVKLAKAVGGQLGEVFNGEITTVEAELGASRAGDPVLELTVTAHDKSHRMHRKTTTRTFRQTTVTDIARKMAGENSLKVGSLAQLSGGAAEERHQVGETDWEYLSGLVHAYGGELDVAGGALHVIDPSQTADPVAELVYGETLQRFRPRVSSVGQVAKVTVGGWNVTQKQAISKDGTPKASTSVENGKVDGDVSGSQVLLPNAYVSTDAEADALAKASAMHLGHERVQGTAVASGDPKLLAGAYVKVSGVGTRFGGTHRIVSAVHVYGARGYTTQLAIGAGGRPLAETMAGARTAPRFADHLVIGVVTDNSDPDNLGRVKVKYPILGDPAVESGWARIAWGAAGDARGTVTLPHVNDEVAIGFEHGDVRRPVILGALFNGVDKPGTDLVKDSSSLAARFPRDLDVETKEKVILKSGKDMTVTADQGPLEINTGKDLTLKATAGGAITIQTDGKISNKGSQGYEITSTAQVKISGTGGVTIESTGQLQLKGSMVQVQATGILQLQGATVMIG